MTQCEQVIGGKRCSEPAKWVVPLFGVGPFKLCDGHVASWNEWQPENVRPLDDGWHCGGKLVNGVCEVCGQGTPDSGS
jgi:hypothetical protein